MDIFKLLYVKRLKPSAVAVALQCSLFNSFRLLYEHVPEPGRLWNGFVFLKVSGCRETGEKQGEVYEKAGAYQCV
jgi:hypothetical protein